MNDFTNPAEVSAKRNDDYKSQMKLISGALNDAQRPETDLSRALDKQYPGSCQWITDNSTFQAWLNAEELDLVSPKTSPEATCRLLWVNGPPGSGKSIATGHIIKYLETLNQDCAYYFFKGSTKTSVSQLLLSIAFQMAETNFEVRRVFLSLISEGEMVGSEDHNVIWNSLFLGHLLKVPFPQPQYWVIDALDECPSRALPTLIQMITRIDPTVPIKVLITSRPNGNVERILGQEKLQKFELRTGQQESLTDIAAYLKSRLSSDGDGWHPEENDGKDVVSEILEKSNGIFLWASLISTRLDEVYTVEQKRDVLRQVPPEMNGVYSDILDAMKGSLGCDLAHCILKWVVCAPQPLTTEEVKAAVWLDIRQTLRSTEKIAQICGNLIVVDQHSHVQLMHQTVREFLIGDESGNYINRSQAHERIAELCLNRLNDKAFDPPRSRALTASSNDADYDAIDKYASTHFSYHLAHCSKAQGSDDVAPAASLMELLASFFQTNILTWIERTATHGKLVHFTRSIQNLRSYFTRHLLNHSPLDSDYQMVESMVEDLARLLAIFGPNLVDMPSSIYGLIPALCPTTSTFYTRFGRDLRQQLIASFNQSWDERLSCFIYQSRVYSVASNEQYLAVGLHNGQVQLYKGATLEPAVSIKHGEPVRQLSFGTISSVLAVCGPRYLSVWNAQQALLWRCAVSPIPLSVNFNADDSKALVSVRTGVVLSFSVEKGMQIGSLPVLDESSDSESDESDSNAHGTTAFVMRLCPTLDLMAAAFRNSHLVIRHIEQDEKIRTFEKEGCEGWDHPPQILDIVFNPVPELNLVAASYLDGEIVTFDPWTRRQKNVVQMYCNTLACSPDGRTLAAGDNEGAIHLFGFDTLKLMYRISTLPERIMGLAFASNSLRIFDIRGSSANVWEPWVLIRRNTADDSSSEAEDHVTIVPEARYTRSFELGRSIVAMTQAGSSHLICGREDGLISVHNLQTNAKPLELQYHARAVPIQLLDWHAKTRTLFSLDVSGRCIAVRFSASWTHERIFDHRACRTVKQSLVKPDGSAYILSTQEGEEYWENGQTSFAISTHSTGSSRWVIHPTSSTHLLLVDEATIHIFQWKGLMRETQESGIHLKLDASIPGPLNSGEWFHRSGNDHLVQIRLAPDSGGIFLLDLSQINSTSTTASARLGLLDEPEDDRKSRIIY
ncbi:hypothetical protein Daus18300_012154 [Diaporthe australafricana]|uniref:NACHT domain-containing protein n=1 Tax=Diaporthe australafricana TaxID=127596 RepID=A0ABR3W3X6_9PEZI